MKAIQVRQDTVNNDLYLGEHPIPVIRDDEVLIQVHYAALNRADLMQRMGKYPPPKGTSDIMGLEVSGVVSDIGRAVPSDCGLKKGTQVAALLPGGGYAEYASAHYSHVMALPVDSESGQPLISLEQAAAIPEAWCTAYLNLCMIGKLRERKSVLIHAGGSGVGTAAIQIAKALGIGTIVTTSSKAKCNACIEYGATLAVDRTESWCYLVKEKHEEGVDLILDCVGADYFENNTELLSTDGQLVCIGLQGGGNLYDAVNLRALLMKRATITFSTLRSRSTEFKTRLCLELMQFTDDLRKFSDRFGRLKVVVDKVFHWNEVELAHQWMQDNKNIGKILLKVISE